MIERRRRIYGWLGAIALTYTLCASAYRSGLFFDDDLYRPELAIIACAVLAGIAACFRAISWRIAPWSLAPFGVAAVYGLLLLLHPASVKGTTDAFLRWTTYGSWMVLLAVFMAGAWRRKLAWAVLLASGAFLVIGGWFGWFGWLRFNEIVFRSESAALASNGARLAGFLQYPNTFGAVTAAFALAQWQLLASAKRSASLAAALLLVPTLGALFLTESRGASLALAAGFICAFWFRRREGKSGYGLFSAGTAVALAALTAHAAFAAMKQGRPEEAAWTLLAATLVGAAAFWLVRWRELYAGRGRWGERWAKAAAAVSSPLGGLLALAVGLGAAYLLLTGGDSGGARVGSNHYETAAARTMYYADALRMFRDAPWLGTGGESWRMRVGEYQSRSYVGNEVHSGYLEILIDTGIVGTLLLLAMFAGYVWKLRRGAPDVWGPAAVLLAHAAIDFDWSYGWVWLLLLYWFALHLSAREPGAGAAAAPAAQGQARAGVRGRAGKLAAPLGAALLLAFATAALPAAWRSAVAASERDAALAATSGARAAQLRAALAADPSWTGIRLELAPLLPARERASLLAAGLRYEPQSAPLEFELGMAYAELADAAAARDHLREALRLGRYDREAQNAAIARMATLADRLAFAGRDDVARVAAGAAVEFYENYRELYRRTYAGRANPWDDKERALFVSAKTNAASAMALLGRTDEARALLVEVTQENSPEWREQAEERLKKLDEGAGTN